MPLTKLKLRRLEKDLTQYDLSLQARVHQARISLAERGYPVLRPDEADRLAWALGASLDDLGLAPEEGRV